MDGSEAGPLCWEEGQLAHSQEKLRELPRAAHLGCPSQWQRWTVMLQAIPPKAAVGDRTSSPSLWTSGLGWGSGARDSKSSSTALGHGQELSSSPGLSETEIIFSTANIKLASCWKNKTPWCSHLQLGSVQIDITYWEDNVAISIWL